MLSNFAIAIVRTFVPILVGFVANLIARFGFHVNDAEIATEISTGVPVVYYAVVRKAEERWPKVGWLLGKPAVPQYREASDRAVLSVPTAKPMDPAPAAPAPAPAVSAPAVADDNVGSGA